MYIFWTHPLHVNEWTWVKIKYQIPFFFFFLQKMISVILGSYYNVKAYLSVCFF